MTQHSETAAAAEGEIIGREGHDGTVVATAQLPNLHIEVAHRAARDGDGERLSIHLHATPSFAAFGQFLDTANPLALWTQSWMQSWTQAVQLAWMPWLGGASLLPLCGGTARLTGPGRSPTGGEASGPGAAGR
ncbi:hypothetical protein [Rhodoplanes serenus]|uniref:hypothetical protein n=1 Tax=Rhodoplanes serenus TaxID=200615 RepID=UPI000DADCAA8|nr:hypothetical protein [Rhodoplanes serenus]RAI35231.1 hypothetical protein CH340_06690 [Rhodoplanes serenus]